MPTNPDPYDDDDDDQPTLQRPPSTSIKLPVAPPLADVLPDVRPRLPEESTATDFVLPVPVEPEYTDVETPKIPLDVAAILLRASQDGED